MVKYDGESGWDTWDIHHYDAKNGSLYFSVKHEDKTTGAKWRNSNYAIHVGSICGIFTKIIASIIALFCASLPCNRFLYLVGTEEKREKGGGEGKLG